MKATELRIGNYIRKGVRCGKITGSDIYELSKMNLGFNGSEYIKSWKPISLNEELLIHFGFKNYSPNYWSDKDKNFRFALLSDGLHCSISGNDSEQGILFKRINYVHELQNLYFVLTGEELEMKPSE